MSTTLNCPLCQKTVQAKVTPAATSTSTVAEREMAGVWLTTPLDPDPAVFVGSLPAVEDRETEDEECDAVPFSLSALRYQ
jgi:hypothetical protein